MHWLPVQQRIKNKINLKILKILNQLAVDAPQTRYVLPPMSGVFNYNKNNNK